MRYGVTGMILRVILIAAFLVVWEIVVRVLHIPAFILPPPSNIFVALYRGFASTLYFSHIGVTLAETFMGFALGTALAFSIGVAVAMSRRVEYFLYPFIVMFQAMPKVALAPLVIIWFGLGITSKVVAAFMQDRVGATFEARITGVTKFGLFVRLKESGAEGLLPARSLGAEYFRFDERAQAMRGERSGTAYGLGDVIPVKLMEAAPVTGGLRFELADGESRPARAHRPRPPGKASRGAEKRRFKPKKR